MKRISILTPCYNEEHNIDELCERVRTAMAGFDGDYEHVFIDNASTDGTADKIRDWASRDPRIKAIFNARNFGHIRSPFHGLLQCAGDAVIVMASDLQDPPERIPEFLEQWTAGYKVVVGVKTESEENGLMYWLRSMYYSSLRRLSDVDLIDHFTGFGLYDRSVIEILRSFNDPYPYFRGMIADIGLPIAKIVFTQPRRRRGLTKNNFYTLYDIAMLGLTSYTKVPLRLITFLGLGTAALSFLAGCVYLVYKCLYWRDFSVGLAPVVIGLFFLGSVQLVFLGVVAEYIGAIYTQVVRRPLVIEKDRVNFGTGSKDAR